MSKPLEVELRIEVPEQLTEEEKELVVAEIEKISCIRRVMREYHTETQRILKWVEKPVAEWSNT